MFLIALIPVFLTDAEACYFGFCDLKCGRDRRDIITFILQCDVGGVCACINRSFCGCFSFAFLICDIRETELTRILAAYTCLLWIAVKDKVFRFIQRDSECLSAAAEGGYGVSVYLVFPLMCMSDLEFLCNCCILCQDVILYITSKRDLRGIFALSRWLSFELNFVGAVIRI